MFIRYENITTEETIDVRSYSEFKSMPLFKHNLPVINEEQHDKIKAFYPSALFIIIFSLYRNKTYIKNTLLNISRNSTNPIIIGCSRGRLRSPIIYLYARLIGIKKCKILFGGIKPIFLRNEKSQ